MSDDEEYIYSDGGGMEEDEDEEEAHDRNSLPKPEPKRPSLSSTAATAAYFKKFVDYVALSPQDLVVEQNQLTQQVSELTGLPEDQASVLLLHLRWNKEQLLERFLLDPDRTLRDAGALLHPQRNLQATTSSSSQRNTFLCPVMYEEVPFQDTLSMGCSEGGEEHRFSLEAWELFLLSRIQDGGMQALQTRCQQDKCGCIVSPRVWRFVLGRSHAAAAAALALSRYEQFLSANFVDANRQIKWCPAVGCGWAIRANVSCRDVTCGHCRTAFCFKCGLDAHLPLSCKGLQQWLEKCSNESETANWFVAHTKTCPQCTTHIEKNQGCNHMTCMFCKYEFCWLCQGKWSDHGQRTGGYYACNKFKDGTAAGDGGGGGKKDANAAKRELDKYIHYYTRYQAHELAGKFASKQREEAEKRMSELQRSSTFAAASASASSSAEATNWIDVQFVMDAVEQLIECRRVLKYTYAYAYSMEDGPRKTLFEYNQGMLENNTERLSELSEMKEGKADRTQTVNYTKVTAQFLKSLLDDVAREEVEGFNTGRN